MQDKMPVRRLPITNLPGQYVLVDGDYDGELFSHHPIRVSPTLGYPQIRWTPALGVSRPKSPWGYVYLHRVVAGPQLPGMEAVYFKNDNKLDCRSANIGWTTRSVVALRRRQGSMRASISGYRGVHKIGRLYYASLNNTYLTASGLADPAEAALIYDVAARERYGTKATLNFPDGQYEQSEGDSSCALIVKSGKPDPLVATLGSMWPKALPITGTSSYLVATTASTLTSPRRPG
jgi:hypothetical protein